MFRKVVSTELGQFAERLDPLHGLGSRSRVILPKQS